METNDGNSSKQTSRYNSNIEMESTDREIQIAALDILNQIEANIESQVNQTKQNSTTGMETSIQIELSASDHATSAPVSSTSNRIRAIRYDEEKSTTRDQSDHLLNNEIINLDSNLTHQILTTTLLEKETYVSQGLNQIDDVKDNELEKIAVEAITDTNESKKQVKLYINELKSEIKTLAQRCDQFNDVKQTIKSMNDLIREEIFLDFGSIITMMRCKLDELTNQIKEKLKDAYSVVRDRQEKITIRLDEIRLLSEQIERENSYDESTLEKLKQTKEQIDLIYDELKQICDSTPTNVSNAITLTAASVVNSISNCSNNCSLFIDNNLYPQFKYFIDLSKLIANIEALEVQILSASQQNISNEQNSIENNSLFYEYKPETNLYCKITGRLNQDGSFWINVLCTQNDMGSNELDENNNLDDFSTKKRHIDKALDKTNVFIEQLSKYVRRKRIGDKSWQTYSEAKRIPLLDEKCFCLDTKSRKWLRGIIEKYDLSTKLCQIRLMDTGHLETFSNLDYLLEWHDDFELAREVAHSIKCYLDLGDNTYFGANNEVCLETKFYFKDHVHPINLLKCTLVKRKNTNENEWIVKLFDKQTIINDLISDFNTKELNINEKPNKTFRSTDIRIETGQLVVKTDDNNNIDTKELNEEASLNLKETEKEVLNASSSSIPQNLNQITSDYSDIEDQNEERRGYKLREGKCIVQIPISEHGIFWIQPTLESNPLRNEYANMSANLGEYITKTQWKSYGLINITPNVGRKCFVRVVTSQAHVEWFRGQIEWIVPNVAPRKYIVRILDYGYTVESCINDIYPHRRFSSDSNHTNKTKSFDTKLEYLAIRCSLTPSGHPIKLNQKAINYFSTLINQSNNGEIIFNLIEQIKLNPNMRRKCWYAELKASNSSILNYKMLETVLFDSSIIMGDKLKYLQFLRSKLLSKVTSLQPSKSIDLSQKSSEPNSTNMSWPSNYEEQQRRQQAKNKNRKKSKDKISKSEQRPLRRKSKSFDQITIKEADAATNESEQNQKLNNQNDEYHTIASGTGIAAAAAALQQSADLSTKYHQYKDKQPSSSSSNNTYSSLPYSSPIQNTSLKLDQPLVDSKTITIEKSNSKPKHKPRQHRTINDSCKSEGQYYKTNKKRDDDDDNDDSDRNFRRRAHTTTNSSAAYHRSFGQQHSHGGQSNTNTNRNKSSRGRNNYNNDEDEYCDDENCYCAFEQQTIQAGNSLFEEINLDLHSNEVFMPPDSSKSIEVLEYYDEDNEERLLTEKAVPSTNFKILITDLNESEIENTRSSFSNENEINPIKIDNHSINQHDESIEIANKIECRLTLNQSSEEEHEEEANKTNSEKENMANMTFLHDLTQAIANRHAYVSPLMSTDSSQKYIQDQAQLISNSKPRSHSEDLTNNNKFVWHQQTTTTPLSNQKLNPSSSSSSSSSSAACSFNKTPQSGTRIKKNSSGTLNKEDDENEDLYASCAEDPENNNNNNNNINNEEEFGYIRNSSPTTLIAPLIQDEAHTLITHNLNKEAQTDEMSLLLHNKRDKLKKFTVAIFIDSFDDYSLNRSSFSSSSSETESLPKPIKENVNMNTSELVVEENIKTSSLKEFELNEANLESVNQIHYTNTQSAKNLTPQLTDDVFMFNANPNNYDNLLHFKGNISLASKPPLVPNTLVFTHHQHQLQQTNNNHFLNISGSNQCLSTITECSNETYETCSNQSPSNNTNHNNNEQENEAYFYEKNITFRKGSYMKALNIDEMFANFCLDANDEIMRNSEENSLTPSSSSQAVTVTKQQDNDKISSKLLEEVINQPLDSPSSSSSSSFSLSSKSKSNENLIKNSSANILDTNNFENMDEVEDEVFLKSNPNQIKSSSSLSNANNNKVSSQSSSSLSSPLPVEKITTPLPLVSPNILTNKLFKNVKSSNMNISTTTTLEISSFNSDSLFNSNFVVTPMGSEAISPGLHLLNNTQSLSIFNTNQLNSQLQQSPLDSNSKSFKQMIKAQIIASPPPPLPPLPVNQINLAVISPTFPSPPKLSIQSPFSNGGDEASSLFPPPPPPPPFLEFTKSINESSKPKEIKKVVTSQQLNSKKNLNKSNRSQGLIETLTARLNLISNNGSNPSTNNNNKQTLGSTRSIQNRIKSPPKLNNSSVNSNVANIITTNNNINKAGYASLGSLITKTNLQKSPITVTSNNEINNEEDDDDESSQQWKASNLYGLDTEEYDDQHSIKDHEELDDEFEKSLPPPPPQFGDEVSFKTPSSSKLNLPLPTPPSFKQTTKTLQNISLNATTNDTLRRFWNNLTSNSITPEPPVATTSLKQPPLTNVKLVSTDLNNNLKQIKQQDNLRVNQSCPNMNYNNSRTLAEQNNDLSSQISSTDSCFNDISESTLSEQFKLDHLININPKHLYKNCKFKGRIHDIIDENGEFWLEVIYPKNDEIKFNQIFRLFRLCSKISQAPKTLYVQKFVSAMYKDNWYRAIVLELHDDNKVLVRFLDLGIAKLVDRYIELREIDEKFFNFPLKSLHCTICLDNMEGIKLNRDARKFFTRLIYKRVLFVKLVDFMEINSTKKNNLVLRQNKFMPNQICQVILGCQTQRGIIDVCMYMLSKYDRKRYEAIRNRDHQEPVSLATTTAGTISSMNNLRHVLCDQNLTKSTSTSYLNLPMNKQQLHQQPVSQQYYDEIDTRKRIQSYDEEEHHDDEDLEDYVEEKVNQSVDLNDTELLDNIYEPEQTDSEINQYENEGVLTTEDDEQTQTNAMFTDLLNSCCIDSSNLINNIDNTILYRESDEETEEDNGLDYLPVKDDNNLSKSSHKPRSYNYSEMLRFDSIHLPPAPPSSQIPISSDFKTPVQYVNLKNNKYTGSTLVASRTKYIHRHMNHYNMPFPPSNPLTSSQMNNLNYSSDTDSSLLHNTGCCSAPIKFKWNATNIQKLKQKLNRSKEAPELSSIDYNNANELDESIRKLRAINTSNLGSKKVKFQIR